MPDPVNPALPMIKAMKVPAYLPGARNLLDEIIQNDGNIPVNTARVVGHLVTTVLQLVNYLGQQEADSGKPTL